jgi:streptogramin lyase
MRSWSLLLAVLLAAPLWAGEGSDLEFGHFGEGHGKLSGLMDLKADAQGNLLVLDWGLAQGNRNSGNGLVQKFDPSGKFLSQIDLHSDDLKAGFDPARLAVDARGGIWVTQPRAGKIQHFGPDGAPRPTLALPQALAIATHGERVYVAPGGERQSCGQIAVFDLDGAPQAPIVLAKPLTNVSAMTADPAGNLWLLANVNQLYRFGPDGALTATLGSGLTTRAQDGSELIHGVTCDSKGNLYTMTWGNPGLVVKFDADLKHVSTREGQFKWADPWSVHSAYTVLATDPQDRLWVGVGGKVLDGTPRYHYKPCVLRTETAFLDPAARGVTVASTLALGLKPSLETPLAYNLGCDLRPLSLTFRVAPANRRVNHVEVVWRAQDSFGAVAGRGQFGLDLSDGQAAGQAFEFQPPRFGWYTVTCEVRSGETGLMAFGTHLGLSPPYAGLPQLAAGESPGGTLDCPRSAWCGLRLARTNTNGSPKELDAAIASAEKYHCLLLVQFESKERCAPDQVKAVAERCAGRVKYWEVVNEPNGSMKPEAYVPLLKSVREIVKAADPAAQILGPDVCGVDLGWYERFYQAGGGPLVDILSVHDYEGHESIDPNHWIWKFGQLRAIMARYGDDKKAVWQTERAIGGIRGDNFLPLTQAIRITLHRDLLDRLGIPSEHSLHFYLDDHGYADVPTFIFSAAGPHPAALALRTRAGLLGERALAATLDFGALGNKLFWGQRYDGPEGAVVILRNLGLADTPRRFRVTGAAELTVSDAFGNESKAPVRGGVAELTLGQLPSYVRLPAGVSLRPEPLDLGPNLAPGVTLSYSAASKGDLARLTNGIFETIHAGNPNGGTDGKLIWQGKLPSLPQTLTIDLGAPRRVSDLVLYGPRADNQFCALLDFDVLAGDQVLAQVRTAFPAAERVRTPLGVANTWYGDTNLHWVRFAPVTTAQLKVVVRRTTCGFLPDEGLRAWGNPIPAQVMLKEIEIYGPPPAGR